MIAENVASANDAPKRACSQSHLPFLNAAPAR